MKTPVFEFTIKTLIYSVSLFIITFLIPCFSFADKETDMVKKVIAKTTQVQKEEHLKNRKWERDNIALIRQLRVLRERRERLETRESKLKNKLFSRKEKVVEQKRVLKESIILEEKLYGYLEKLVLRLESFTKSDIPFLLEERKKRLASIKEILRDPDKANSEKYRRVLEAVRIETDYGDSVEVYKEKILIDKKDVMVDLLRVGRVSLFFANLTAKKSGFYNPSTKNYEYLPDTFFDEIKKSVEVAKGGRVPSIVKLPIGRIVTK
ncbi:MAG: DUF3450 domain-containing protein [Desulfobacterales bacterium]|nr:DUF3450 domain-containing protein [Desulfobacterales bacterium]MCP4161251.1 DUF3450 domain-containing protein [Deltaproteobacteria bacterium]